MYVLGLDVGTTFTAAAVWRDGRADICPLGTHATSIPSVVMLRDDEFLVGEPAVRRALSEPTRVAREFKRRFGDSTPVLLGDVPYSAEALTARLIRSVVDDVARREGGHPSAVCVSHPANWGPFRIELLRSTLRMVDLQVPVDFVTEPEAAAISFSQEKRLAVGEIVAVYDLGGGTFDAAVLRRTETGFEILGEPEGIERLGGIDVDAAVFRHVTAVLRSRYDDPRLLDPDEDDLGWVTGMARLRQECTAAKEALSADGDVSVPVFLPGLSTDVRMTRAELESMIRPALHDSVAALRRAVRSADVPAEEVSAVLLVGGSSRIPLVGELVAAALGRPVTVDAHPKHGVALGAAWVASRGAATEDSTGPAPVPPPVALPPRELQPPWPTPVPVAPPTTAPTPAPLPGAAAVPVDPPPHQPTPPLPALDPSPIPVPVAASPAPPVAPAAIDPATSRSPGVAVGGEERPPRPPRPRLRTLVPVGLVAVSLAAALAWQYGRNTGSGESGDRGAGVAASSSAVAGSSTATAAAPAAVTGKTLIISSDLPLQGSSKAVSAATNTAIELYLASVGHRAGNHTIKFLQYDDSTTATSRWDPDQCRRNGTSHVQNQDEVAVLGAYNSGCTKALVPVLNAAAGGPLLLVSHASTDPGLTKAWGDDDPSADYARGGRNFARVVPPDDVQGRAAAQFLAQEGVKRVYVLHDTETYGQGLAGQFAVNAEAAGMTVLGNEAWDATATSYTSLFRKVRASGAEAIYLSGFVDSNGLQLIKDKVEVLGDNAGVKLIAPEAFTDSPELTALPEAQGMYLTLAGLSIDLARQRKGPGTTTFLDAYRAATSAEASPQALYGVAALQVVLAAIEASDGTRQGVTNAVFGGSGVTVPADVSVLGEDLRIDPKTGDVVLKDITIEIIKDKAEVPLQAVTVR